MDSAPTLTELANRLHQTSASTGDKAEFIRLVAELKDVDVLKNLLSVSYGYAGTVLQPITELLPDDPKAYLSLALWNYNNGLDDEALDLFEKARDLAPRDREILRADLCFHFHAAPRRCAISAAFCWMRFPMILGPVRYIAKLKRTESSRNWKVRIGITHG